MNRDDAERIVEEFVAPLGRVDPVALRLRTVRRRRLSWIPVALAGTAVLAGAVVAIAVRRPEPPPAGAPIATHPAPTVAHVLPAAETTISPDGITRRDLATGRTTSILRARVLVAVPSPDETRVAYTTFVRGDPGSCRLAVLDVAAGTTRQLASNCGDAADDRRDLNRVLTLSVDGDVYRLQPLFGPTWSPDGKRIAFGCKPTLFKICVVAPDGATIAEVGLATGIAISPAFSPDGARIAFLGGAAPHFDVWVANADGTAPKRVATLQQDSRGAARPWLGWSPDGRRLLAWASRPEVVDIARGTTSLQSKRRFGDLALPITIHSP